MKRADLMKQLTNIARERGETLIVTEGANHTKVRIGTAVTMIPRHREIKEPAARTILRQARKEQQ